MDQLFLFSLCNFSSSFGCVIGIPVTNHFSLLLIDRQLYFGYSNYNTQGVFATLFFICSDLLNFLRSLGTMVITTESGKTASVIFTWQFLAKVAIFLCFDVCYIRPPQNFKFKRKYQQYGPCFQIIFPFLMAMLELNMMTESKKWKK